MSKVRIIVSTRDPQLTLPTRPMVECHNRIHNSQGTADHPYTKPARNN